MKRRINCTLTVPLLLITFSGCSTRNTDLSIPEKEIPAAFHNQKKSATIAGIKWRQYFSDALLQKLIDTALSNNMDLQMALQRIEMSRASVKLANGALLPQVGLNVGGSVRRFGLYTMDGAGNASTEITPGQTVPVNLPDMYVGLQSSWEVDIWGKLRNQRKSAISQYLSSIEGTNFVISNLVADVAIYCGETFNMRTNIKGETKN